MNILNPKALYVCDNGACYCGAHAGYSAKTTGRDISGQLVYEVRPAEAKGFGIKCEECPA